MWQPGPGLCLPARVDWLLERCAMAAGTTPPRLPQCSCQHTPLARAATTAHSACTRSPSRLRTATSQVPHRRAGAGAPQRVHMRESPLILDTDFASPARGFLARRGMVSAQLRALAPRWPACMYVGHTARKQFTARQAPPSPHLPPPPLPPASPPLHTHTPLSQNLHPTIGRPHYLYGRTTFPW